MESLLAKLQSDFPALAFAAGNVFSWSPSKKQVIFDPSKTADEIAIWSLLHETAHGLLEHRTYQSDFELLLMESAAWQHAQTLAKKYKIHINPDHIEDCLDTYRDWLYQRSTCPTCLNTSLQSAPNNYHCFNCQTKWRVSKARFCRPYRIKEKGAVS
jgi:hypothetical protein